MLLSAGNRLSRKQLARLNRARHRRQLKSDTRKSNCVSQNRGVHASTGEPSTSPSSMTRATVQRRTTLGPHVSAPSTLVSANRAQVMAFGVQAMVQA
jgi:hypothetical protein